MTVEWRNSRWSRPVGAALRILKPPLAQQGVLLITADVPKALGKMEIQNAAGETLYTLIDARANSQKAFYLPASLAGEYFSLLDEAGQCLFSLGEKPVPEPAEESAEHTEQNTEPTNQEGETEQ